MLRPQPALHQPPQRDVLHPFHTHPGTRFAESIQPLVNLGEAASTPAVLSGETQIGVAIGEYDLMHVSARAQPSRRNIRQIAETVPRLEKIEQLSRSGINRVI